MKGRVFVLLICISMVPQFIFAEVPDAVKFTIGKNFFKDGMHYYNNMQYLASVEFFRKAIEQYPEYYSARDYLGRAYKLAGFTDAALKEWESLLQIMPANLTVKNKIDTLRFFDASPTIGINKSNYIYFKRYQSSQFERYGFSHPVDLSIDNEKNVYLTSFDTGSLVKFDLNGNPLFSIKIGYGGRLYGIDYLNERLVISNFEKNEIYIATKNGKTIKQFGSQGAGNGQFFGPEGVCFDRKGNIYVVDSGNSRVQKFTSEGTFIFSFGKKGEYEDQLQNPTDVVAIKDKVYITDTKNKRIAIYDDSGNFIKNILHNELIEPRGISVRDDTLLIADTRKGLLFYDLKTSEKNWMNSWQENKPFSRLISSTVDRDGYLYCLDYNYETFFLMSPVQRRYSNLLLDITSVDINRFPAVAFYVNIVSREGKPVYGLDKSNFEIYEDGARMKNIYIDYLKRRLPSVSMVMCIDRSMKNKEYHNDMPWLADFVLKKMRTNDSIKVLNFNKDVWEGNKFDWSRRRTQRAIAKNDYGTGKDIGKALYTAISDLLPQLNRRGVFFVTDGLVDDDSFAKYSYRHIIHYAKMHFIPVYILSFKKPHRYLEEIARETGGAIIRTNQLNKLRTIYTNIKNSEEYRYVLVYSSYKIPAFQGWWSDVKIRVNYKGEKGVEQGGYFIP